MERREAVVIGAGPAGLSVAAMLRKRGIDALVVDRADAVGSSWRRHYDRLHLHTVRWLSNLPGLRLSRKYGKWVSRDGVVDYLERFARHHKLDLKLGTEVSRVDRSGDRWVVRTGDGDIEADDVVVATGYNHTPFFPDWPGRDGFTGELVHAARYRNPEPYRGRDVVVIGSGNTGAEIAVDLVEGGAGRVRLAVRTPPNIVLREPNGVPNPVPGVLFRYFSPKIVDPLAFAIRKRTIGDLEPYGLPMPDRGPFTRMREDHAIPIVDVGVIDMVKKGNVEVVAGLVGFDGAKVLLADDSAIEPDVVIVATGFRRGLEPLVGHLGVIRENGRPVVDGARQTPDAPGLWFIGYTNPVSGMFRQLNIDSRRIARALSRRRRAAGA
ncbi:MAG: hypothetical protein QOE08_747 [Thermoleophilaceae bacterium]|jgi:cation diffusion facilitator CzcD-associated flavoprotein CzcO|nr:hypothetical protein [Thermoleophilaceae bacterium]